MAIYRASVTSPSAPEVVFDYLARFSSAVEWDPGVVASRDVRPGGVQLGSRFDLTVRTLGHDSSYRYEVIELDRPRRVVLQAETGSFRSTDTIAVVGAGGGSEVTYEACLEPRGWARVLSPVLPALFRRVGDRAAEGLRRSLADLPGSTCSPRSTRARA